MHVVTFVDGLNVPGAHGIGASEPIEQNVPSGHAKQSSLPTITAFDASMRVPPGHGNAAAAPSPQ